MMLMIKVWMSITLNWVMMIMIIIVYRGWMKFWMSITLNWVQDEVAKFLQCSSIDSMLPSLPESGASLYLYLYLRICVFVFMYLCSSIDSILPSRPESGASLYLYLYLRICVFVFMYLYLYLQCSSIDSMLLSRPESGASLYLYLYSAPIFVFVSVPLFYNICWFAHFRLKLSF